MSETTRLRLPYPEGGDAADVPDWMKRLASTLDVSMLGYAQGTLAGRPTAAVQGRMYYATDDGCLYYDTSTVWVPAAWQPGDVRWTATKAATPDGWRVCDGRELAATSYPALFTAIGTAFGGNSVRFMLPDLRGRTAVGTGTGRFSGILGLFFNLTPRGLGDADGTESHTLIAREIPDHTHSINDPGHRHSPGSGGVFATNSANNIMPYGGYFGGNVGSDSLTTVSGTGVTINPTTGGGSAHNNMQPFVALNAWIKT